jgi:hypothetical protein
VRNRWSNIWLVSKEELAAIVAESSTYTEALAKLNLKNKGGNHYTLKKRLIEDGVDVRHFYDGSRKTMGRPSIERRIPNEILFQEDSKHSPKSVRRRLIKDKLLPYVCADCGMAPEWNGKAITLVMDHINGKSDDHRLTNLRWLCPNCNSQQPTFCGRNYLTKNLSIYKQRPPPVVRQRPLPRAKSSKDPVPRKGRRVRECQCGVAIS